MTEQKISHQKPQNDEPTEGLSYALQAAHNVSEPRLKNAKSPK